MEAKKLTRFQKDADQFTKKRFAKELIQALDALTVEPGEEFLVAPTHQQISLLTGDTEDWRGRFETLALAIQDHTRGIRSSDELESTLREAVKGVEEMLGPEVKWHE